MTRAWSSRYIRTSVAIWSLRLRPARSRPPSSGPTLGDQRLLEGAVHVLVRSAAAAASRRRPRAASASSPACIARASSAVEVPGRGERRGVGVRAGDVVGREHPVEVRRPAERDQFRRRPGGEPGAPERALVGAVRFHIHLDRHRERSSTTSDQHERRDPVTHSSGPRPIEERPRGACCDHEIERHRPERLQCPESPSDLPRSPRTGRRDDGPRDELGGVGRRGASPPPRRSGSTTQRMGVRHRSRHAPSTARANPPEPMTSNSPLECGSAVQARRHTVPKVSSTPPCQRGEERRATEPASSIATCTGTTRDAGPGDAETRRDERDPDRERIVPPDRQGKLDCRAAVYQSGSSSSQTCTNGITSASPAARGRRTRALKGTSGRARTNRIAYAGRMT